MEEKFNKWDIQNKIIAVATDNANNIVAAVKLGNWRHLGCFAYTINLIGQKGLKEIEEILFKITKLVEIFKRSSNAFNQTRTNGFIY